VFSFVICIANFILYVGGAADVRIHIMLYFVSITKYYVFEDSVTVGVLSKRLELGAAQI
jgi:hypothetical protein